MLPAASLVVTLLAAVVSAREADLTPHHLVSKRYPTHDLSKRFIDEQGNTNLSFIHVNDIHARLDEFGSSGNDCNRTRDDTCFGGAARMKTEIDRLRAERNNDSLLLDAGDQFQGTLFYSYYGGEAISAIMQQMGFDVATLGNHEFDDGEDALTAYLSNLSYPFVCANIETENTNLSSRLVPYQVFPEHSLAILGVLTPTTKTIASPAETTNFTDPVTAAQQTVDTILANENVTRIVALTHIGYEEDLNLAQNTRNISLIIGGHSHTPLGDVGDPEVESAGSYPSIATNLDGDEVFVVTAWRWGQVLGHIDVLYDTSNKIIAYSGQPVPLNDTTPQNETLQAQVQAFRAPFDEFSQQVIGETEVVLSNECYEGECTLGSVMCDAFIWYRQQAGGSPDGAIQNAGGVRSTIDIGPVSRGDVLTAFPFGNSVVDVEFTGQEIVDTFEGIVSGINLATEEPITGFVQVGGIRFSYNPAQPVGQRLISLDIGVPEPAPVDLAQTYTITTIDFVAGGGDSFFEKSFTAILDTQDEVLTQYIQAESPIEAPSTGRISAVDSTTALRNATTASTRKRRFSRWIN